MMLSDYYIISEAVKTIFTHASDEERAVYERQLENIKKLDPVLIITPNITWINQHGVPAFIMLLWTLLQQTVFQAGAEMKIHAQSSTSPVSLNYTQRGGIYATLFLTLFTYRPLSNLNTPLLNCILLEQLGS